VETSAENPVDIVEIDAASNNGVDSVREIRDRVNLLPAVCRYKVYIIDEVHMLSKGAFNALLKTLEEPPAHVIFILATTEPHKLPATILSRCQRFDFKRISTEDITARLTEVAKGEGYEFDVEALRTIARAAEGGLRDALSILDQCAASGAVTQHSVTAALGSGDMHMLYELIDCITAYDEKGALERLSSLLMAGADTRALIKDLAETFRHMMWLSVGAGDIDDSGLEAKAKSFGKNACIRALNILIQKEYEMRQNLRADIVLETAVMALMCPEDDDSAPDRARIEKLEARIAALEKRPAAAAPVQPVQTEAPRAETPVKAAAKTPKKADASVNQGVSDAQDLWNKLLDALKADAYFAYPHAVKAKQVMRKGDDGLEITFGGSAEVAADFLRQPPAQKAVGEALEKMTGNKMNLNIIVEKELGSKKGRSDILAMFGDKIEEI
jgi:DNA polymerase-3 subunit gamma/tau